MSNTSSSALERLQLSVDEFTAKRDWGQFHTPKNLAMALTVEAAELMEIFQWLEGQKGVEGVPPHKLAQVEEEVADIFIYLLRFCSVTGIDLLKAAENKVKANEAKYPAELVRGKSAKYTEY